jgi:hypothetical protein
MPGLALVDAEVWWVTDEQGILADQVGNAHEFHRFIPTRIGLGQALWQRTRRSVQRLWRSQ